MKALSPRFHTGFVARRVRRTGERAGETPGSAEAYLDSTLSAVTKRNKVDAALSRAGAESV